MRTLKLISIIFICALALSFPVASVATANGLLLDENFESVEPGDIPSDWWSYCYYGGCFARAWVEEIEDNNVLSLSTAWAALAGPADIVLLDYAVGAFLRQCLNSEINYTTSGELFKVKH